jgi:hypothetical protein
MGLFDWVRQKSSDEVQEITNPDLVAAIQVVKTYPSERTRQNLQKVFLASTPLIALRTLPEGLKNGSVVLTEDTPITAITSTDEVGKTVLLVFSDLEALRKRIASSAWIIIPASQLLKYVLLHDYAGIVINPAGSWSKFSRDEVEKMATLT